MFYLFSCIVITCPQWLLEELALSKVTVGGNVKAAGELLACALCTCCITLYSCILYFAQSRRWLLEQCGPILQLPSTLHIASTKIQWHLSWSSRPLCSPMRPVCRNLNGSTARAMEAFEWRPHQILNGAPDQIISFNDSPVKAFSH